MLTIISTTQHPLSSPAAAVREFFSTVRRLVRFSQSMDQIVEDSKKVGEANLRQLRTTRGELIRRSSLKHIERL
jgi:hypothetical protein